MNRRSRYTLLSLCILFIISIAAAEIFQPRSMTARQVDSTMHISWTSASEAGVSDFVVMRAVGGSSNFTRIGRVTPKGIDGSVYEYIDTPASIFKTTSWWFSYMVVAEGPGGIVLESTTPFGGTLSSTPRTTWGSIKAMFR